MRHIPRCLNFQCIDDPTLDKLIGETYVILRHRIDEHLVCRYRRAGAGPESLILYLHPIGAVLM
jgi:hypothetical protein